jgi:hypothetical protein
MAPTWTDGALLGVVAARAETLRPGDGIVFHNGEQVVAHRLLRRRYEEGWWWLQPKADAGCTPEPWQPETALIGRIVAIEARGRQQRWDQGWGLLRQRAAGWWQQAHVAGHGAWQQLTRQGSRIISPWPWPVPETDPRLTWGRNMFLRERLAACVRVLAPAGIESMLLKGQALILTGVMDPAERPMADVDLLVKQEQAASVLHLLQAAGYRLRGPTDALRASLDDQLPFEDPSGVVFDVHWGVVTGGWRFRDVIRLDYEGLWARSQRWDLDGVPVRVMAPVDQLLHLCSHLILSGATGHVWWQDLRRFLEHQGKAIDWSDLLIQARQARLRTIVWLSLDTLWQRWQVPVPPQIVRALRPAPWRRWLLRSLLPADLSTAADESRWQRHTRELLLMDRPIDRLRLLWRWSHPPAAWHAYKAGTVTNFCCAD